MKKSYLLTTLVALLVLTGVTSAQSVGRTNKVAGVTLAWDYAPGITNVTFNIYYGPATASYTNVVNVGFVLTTSIKPLVRKATYYFAATAVETGTGLESDYSNEVSYTVPAQPPAPVIRSATTMP